MELTLNSNPQSNLYLPPLRMGVVQVEGAHEGQMKDVIKLNCEVGMMT